MKKLLSAMHRDFSAKMEFQMSLYDIIWMCITQVVVALFVLS